MLKLLLNKGWYVPRKPTQKVLGGQSGAFPISDTSLFLEFIHFLSFFSFLDREHLNCSLTPRLSNVTSYHILKLFLLVTLTMKALFFLPPKRSAKYPIGQLLLWFNYQTSSAWFFFFFYRFAPSVRGVVFIHVNFIHGLGCSATIFFLWLVS